MPLTMLEFVGARLDEEYSVLSHASEIERQEYFFKKEVYLAHATRGCDDDEDRRCCIGGSKEGPCAVLEALAAVYSYHPDWSQNLCWEECGCGSCEESPEAIPDKSKMLTALGQGYSFVEACASGVASVKEVDDWVDEWHEGPYLGEELPDFLGLFDDEYNEWIHNPNSIGLIVEARRLGMKLVYVRSKGINLGSKGHR